MRAKLFKISLVIFILIWGCSKAPLEPDSGDDGNLRHHGALNVAAVDERGRDIDSVKVFLNGESVGYAPLSVDSIAFGIHALRAQKEGYQIHTENVTIDNAFTVNREIVLREIPLNSGQLLITVNQDSARTTVSDGSDRILEQTYRRELMLTLEAGGYFIRCEKPGFELVLKAVNVRMDTTTIANIELRRLTEVSLPQIVLAIPDSGIVDQPVLVSWESSNATRVTIDRVDNAGLYGKQEVTFRETGMHYINAVAHNAMGQATDVDSVFIYRIADAPPEIDVAVNPERIYSNEVCTISWQSKNATQVVVDYVPNPGISGKWQERFYQPGMVVINAHAFGPGGEAHSSDTLYVDERSRIRPEISLNIEPKRLIKNQSAIIQWQSKNAQSVAVDFVPNPGLSGQWETSFANTGQIVVHAYAYGDGGQMQASDTIYVSDPDFPAPMVSIKAAPEEVLVNEDVTIQWSSTHANRVNVDFVPNPGLAGQWKTKFSRTGTYIIHAYAYGDGGQVTAADTIRVVEFQIIAPRIMLEVYPKQVTRHEKVTIRWNSNYAKRVDVDFVPSPGLNGQWQTQFTAAGEIVVHAHAYGDGGEAHVADTLQVLAAVPPLLDFSVSPTEIDYDQTVLLTWHTNGYQVMIDHGLGLRGPVGSEELKFLNPGLKILTAVAYGEDQLTTVKSDTVFVRDPEEPTLPVISLSVVDSVEVGQPALVEWHSWNATDVDVDYVGSPGLNGKTEIVFNTPGDRLITATAYNQAGQVTVEELLIVVNAPVMPQVQNILVPSGAKVVAVHTSQMQSVENAGTANVEVAGYYRVIAAAWYNSGDDQKNESFYITINGMTPEDPNAGHYKVVPDDPGAPHVAERDAGLFYLDEGVNIISLYHYYLIAKQYPQFVVDGPIRDAESIQVLYFKLEYVPQNDRYQS